MTEFKLGPLQTKWLEALESGEYEKGIGALHCGKTHCCLGVADLVCELGETDDNGLYSSYRELGLNSALGQFDGERIEVRNRRVQVLTELNDHGMTFAEIAALIRSRPHDFFTESK